MEMERINENTIRVLIGNEDLVARGITFLDLLGNHKQIESFFYSILEEVDEEEQFEETDAVTFQVLPNRDGLELFISKNIGAAETTDLSAMPMNLEAGGMASILGESQLDPNEDDEEWLADDVNVGETVLQLRAFEDMIQLAREVYLEHGKTNLYKLGNQYFLEVIFLLEDISDREMENEISQLLEFAVETSVTPELLSEYGKKIMDKNALELTRYYFK